MVRSLDGEEVTYFSLSVRREGESLVGVKALRLANESTSSKGERLVGVISTSISERAGLTASTCVFSTIRFFDGVAKGFFVVANHK